MNRTYDVSGEQLACGVAASNSYGWQPQVSGTAIKTIWDIENREIPNVASLIGDTLTRLGKDEYATVAKRIEDVERLRQLNASHSNWQYIVAQRDLRDTARTALVDPADFYSFVKCKEGGDSYVNCSRYAATYASPPPSPPRQFRSLQSLQSTPASLGSDLIFDPTRDAIFFSGGGSTISMASSWSASQSVERTTTHNLAHLTGSSFFTSGGFAGAGAEYTNINSYTVTTGKSTSTSTSSESTTAVEFTLGDPEVGDYFNVQVRSWSDRGSL